MGKELQNNVWTRLVNVLYGVGWIGILIILGIAFIATKPYDFVDHEKSYVTCLSNNSKYTFDNIQDSLYKVDDWYSLDLDAINDKAQWACINVAENNLTYSQDKKTVWSEEDKDWFPNTEENRTILTGNLKDQSPQGIYKINEIHSTNGSWDNVILWMVGLFIVLSILLDLIRSTLLYLIGGRSIKASDFVLLRIITAMSK